VHVNRLESGVLAGFYKPISSQDAIKRRFNEFGVNNDFRQVNKTDGVQTWPLALRVFVLQ